MTRALRSRLARLERTTGRSAGSQEIGLTPISNEELEWALSVPWNGDWVARVSTISFFVPRLPEAARAVEQAAQIKEYAMNLGHSILGFQRDTNRYLDAALPEMFPEPRSEPVQAIIDAILEARLSFIACHIVPAIDGGMPPDGWREQSEKMHQGSLGLGGRGIPFETRS